MNTTRRILLADDDEGVRAALGQVLLMEGYVVIPARNGLEAVQLAAATELDAVVLDLRMPLQGGWDTFESLSRDHPLTPVLIVTACPNQLFTALGAGVAALLEKPVDIPALLSTLSRLMAEPVEARLARLAGQEGAFDYRPSQQHVG